MPKLALLAALLVVPACHGHAAHHAAPTAAPLTEVNIAVPIAPGKTAAWQAALEELLGPRYAEYDASRRRYGVTSQTTFLQQTPMGDFAVIHMTGPDVRASFHAMSTSQDPWDVKWRALTLNLHGMDFAKGERVTPQVEPAYEMDSGDAGTARPFMFVAPLAPEGVARFRALAAELMGARHDDYVRARRRLGIHRETVILETTAMGAAAVFYWLADDPQASLAQLAASTDPFDVALRADAGRAHPLPIDAIAAIAAHNALVGQYPHE